MTRHLDPRFGRILDFMAGAGSNIEREAARENAEAVAKASGYSYAEALAAVREPAGPFVAIEPEPDAADDPGPDASYPSTERDRAIAAALAADPSRSDRDVARMVGCSPTDGRPSTRRRWPGPASARRAPSWQELRDADRGTAQATAARSI